MSALTNARTTLLAHAQDTDDPATLALAGVLGAALERHGCCWLPLPGLDATATRALLQHWFAGADRRLGLDWPALAGAHRHEARQDEIDDLASLLREYANPAAGSRAQTDAVAYALACASLGQQHLWQDLLLPSRRELSALIWHWFPRLAERNQQDMKWKKFFYRQLCLREQLPICRAPSCAVCADYGACFGAE